MKVSDFIHEMTETSAVFGRKSDIKVVFEGDQAKTDGDTIYLPAMDMEADLTFDQIMTMRGLVDHEAGHLRHSDMDRILDFYGRCHSNGRAGLASLHNCLEDVWMEGKVADEYPGSYKNLKHLGEVSKKKECLSFEEAGKVEVLKEVNEASVGAGIKAHNPIFKYPETSYVERFKGYLSEEMREWTSLWAKQAAEAKNSEELITLAKSIWKLLENDPELQKTLPEDFDPTSGEGMDEGEISEEYKKAKEKDNTNSKGEVTDSKDTEQGEGGLLTNDDLPDGYLPDPSDLVMDSAQDAHNSVGGIGNPGGPLKSKGYRIFSTKGDEVFERGKPGLHTSQYNAVVNSNDHQKYKKVKAGISAEINVMKTKLRRALLSRQRRDWDTARESGRLDTKRLVNAYNRVPTVYKQRIDREEEDTAITILVDLSGSMGGKKIEVARDCAVALSECLEGSGLSFKVVGFCYTRTNKGYSHSKGKYHRYECLDSVVFKKYEDTLRVSQGAIANIPDACGGNNSDYDFIKQEIFLLKKRPETRKVLFVLSDGSPACATDASTGELIKHCKKAIDLGKRDGVESVGVGICDSTVKEIYADNVVVNSVSDLASTVFNKLTTILVGVK